MPKIPDNILDVNNPKLPGNSFGKSFNQSILLNTPKNTENNNENINVTTVTFTSLLLGFCVNNKYFDQYIISIGIVKTVIPIVEL